jgi:hypothetical protein
MALANVAWVLALNGNRVLVVDWDLEAPGLHRFFHPFLDDKELLATRGLLDMVEHLAAQAAASEEPLSSDQVDIIDYIEPLEWPRDTPHRLSWKQFGPRARIDLLTAGRQGPAYSRKVSSFNWIDFYERLGGRRLLCAARAQMRNIYDYVLIDSRTGVSDTSGICTVEMPDTVVICFTLNNQSIRGAAAVAESVYEQRKVGMSVFSLEQGQVPVGKESQFRIFPVPMRVEITSERDKREAALDLAQKTFSKFLNPLLPGEESKYWGSVQLAYFPFYAFEEIPAVFGDKPNELFSFTTTIKQITQFITEPPLRELPPLARDGETAEKIRKEILSWYLRPTTVAAEDPVRLAEEVFNEFDEQAQGEMMRVLLRTVLVGPAGTLSTRAVPIKDFDSSAMQMAQRLSGRGLLVISETQGVQTAKFSDVTLVEKWDRLRRWIDADRQFLAWRMALDTSEESWKLSELDESALLRGRLLDEALKWSRERPFDLSPAEQDFIDKSVVERRRQEANFGSERNTQKRLSSRWKLAIIIITTAIAFLGALALLTLQMVRVRKAATLAQEEATMAMKERAMAEQAMAAASNCPGFPVGSLPGRGVPSSFKSNGHLSWPCVLRMARAIQRQETAFKRDGKTPQDGLDSSGFVTYILRANGLDVNPRACDATCLKSRLQTIAKPSPGDLVLVDNNTIMFYLGDDQVLGMDGSEKGVREGSLSNYKPSGFLKVPYDDR